jgi:hypothetical protein
MNLSTIIHRLKRNKKLNTSLLESLLSAGLEHLDLEDTFLSGNCLDLLRCLK